MARTASNKSDVVSTECICPKCGTDHKMMLKWTGRGKPKKFCHPCARFADGIGDLEFFPLHAEMAGGAYHE